jgi:hypothetical protein
MIDGCLCNELAISVNMRHLVLRARFQDKTKIVLFEIKGKRKVHRSVILAIHINNNVIAVIYTLQTRMIDIN